jgi:hypothetical protein
MVYFYRLQYICLRIVSVISSCGLSASVYWRKPHCTLNKNKEKKSTTWASLQASGQTASIQVAIVSSYVHLDTFDRNLTKIHVFKVDWLS